MNTVILILGATLLLGSAQLAAAQSSDGTGRAVGGYAPRPGDAIRLRIWREPDMSGEFVVDQEGTVVLPRIGPIQATETTFGALKEQLIATYSRFLIHSAIEVTLLRRVQVLGAVRTPGLYPVDETMTVSDVLALAGGMTRDGVRDRVELIRYGQPVPVKLSQRALLSETPIQSGDQLYVPERSWISRNPGILAAVISATVTLLIAFTR